MRFGERLKNWLSGNDPQPPQHSTEVVEERKNMIEGIEELAETTVKEVMVPRRQSPCRQLAAKLYR